MNPSDQEASGIIVAFANVRSLFGTYGMRVSHVWVFNWAFATDWEREWFNQMILCRIDPRGTIHWVGWDGSVIEEKLGGINE